MLVLRQENSPQLFLAVACPVFLPVLNSWVVQLMWGSSSECRKVCVWSAVFKRLIFEAIITFVFFKDRLINMLMWSVMKTEFKRSHIQFFHLIFFSSFSVWGIALEFSINKFSLNSSYLQNLLSIKLQFRMMTNTVFMAGDWWGNNISFHFLFLPNSSIRTFKRQQDSIIVSGLWNGLVYKFDLVKVVELDSECLMLLIS